MRSLSLTLILIPLLMVGAGCKKRRSSGQAQMLASTIYAGDPNVATHFVKGFYDIEENSWRWTGKDFSVDLSAPLHADKRGAQLVLRFAIPEAVMQKVHSEQLSASIAGYKLEPQIYNQPGKYTYTRDVPADKLQNDVLRIDFSVDHTIPPAGVDIRELGIIVSEVGLVAK